ncbi:hypothetical protein IscW_ISCW000575 [Ixodes scapularis]|uniref:Uncharacterized protein n=1 Tax=Ixodes scapularis TaxID=6945 RepID=B7P6V0_IXOSC|nr:hypothetical protein IscW_ISCW000575 [Ixodes scapularis]|eukprot:XP_002409236.1 hypothetical protein IscW_ISCW000575 [Ixodes scapularis]
MPQHSQDQAVFHLCKTSELPPSIKPMSMHKGQVVTTTTYVKADFSGKHAHASHLTGAYVSPKLSLECQYCIMEFLSANVSLDAIKNTHWHVCCTDCQTLRSALRNISGNVRKLESFLMQRRVESNMVPICIANRVRSTVVLSKCSF